MKNFLLIFFTLLLIGCATTQQQQTANKEELDAMKSVAEAMTGEEMTDEQMRQLAHDLEHNEETQEAVQSITNALGSEQKAIKYCPLDGKRYSAHLEYCPGTDVPLKNVE